MAGAECFLAAVRGASATSPATRQNWGYSPYIPCVQTPVLSALHGGSCLESASRLGCEAPRSPPILTCFIGPKTSPRHSDHWRRQNLGRPFESRHPAGHKSSVPFAVYRPMSPDHRHWFRRRNNLGYCLVRSQLRPAPGTGDFLSQWRKSTGRTFRVNHVG